MEQTIQYEISYGAIAGPISKQLKDQGFDLPEGKLAYFDRIKDALNALRFNDLTTDSMHRQLVLRANKYIKNEVQKHINKEGIKHD